MPASVAASAGHLRPSPAPRSGLPLGADAGTGAVLLSLQHSETYYRCLPADASLRRAGPGAREAPPPSSLRSLRSLPPIQRRGPGRALRSLRSRGPPGPRGPLPLAPVAALLRSSSGDAGPGAVLERSPAAPPVSSYLTNLRRRVGSAMSDYTPTPQTGSFWLCRGRSAKDCSVRPAAPRSPRRGLARPPTSGRTV